MMCEYKEDLNTGIRLNENGFVCTVSRCALFPGVFCPFYFADVGSSQ